MACASPGHPAAAFRARPELADVFRVAFAEAERMSALTPLQRQVVKAIVSCRTVAMGGHVERCDHCGASRAVYHSCGNRHCPKCQVLAKERWLEARRAELLPIPYFHVVFTLPHEINWLARCRPRVVYDLLFRAAAQTLQVFGRDDKHLGGEIGITAILHTWTQDLSQHVHLHCVVTGGALATDESRWIRARRSFLFPVRALSKVFRGKYLDGLRRAAVRGCLPADLALPDLLQQLSRHEWVVYCKPPFGGPEQVLGYLGRYTHRIALSNERLVDLDDTHVRFRWRDRGDDDRVKSMTLTPDEFMRRFLLHVVPKGFVRIRHFGLLANRHRVERLRRCRELLDQPATQPTRQTETAEALLLRLTGTDLLRCPTCQVGRMHRSENIPALPPFRARPPPLAVA